MGNINNPTSEEIAITNVLKAEKEETLSGDLRTLSNRIHQL
jgi:hypothetical protein